MPAGRFIKVFAVMLVTGQSACVDTSADERPQSVPKGALLVRGSDGSVWVACRHENTDRFNCAVFDGTTGVPKAQGVYMLRDMTFDALANSPVFVARGGHEIGVPIAPVGFEDEIILLADHGALVPQHIPARRSSFGKTPVRVLARLVGFADPAPYCGGFAWGSVGRYEVIEQPKGILPRSIQVAHLCVELIRADWAEGYPEGPPLDFSPGEVHELQLVEDNPWGFSVSLVGHNPDQHVYWSTAVSRHVGSDKEQGLKP